MSPIKLIDATEDNPGMGPGQHVELQYAAPDAKRSFFLGQIPALGIVRGFICPGCGQIKLHGAKRENE
jgi:hypothetical protein